MNITSPYFKLLYRFILTVVAIISSVISFTYLSVDVNGIKISPTLYYTNWSVWLVTLTSIIYLCLTYFEVVNKKELDNTFFEAIYFSSTVTILPTLILPAFAAPEKIWTVGYWTLGSIFKHFLLPMLFLIDAFLYVPKNKFKNYFPFVSWIPAFLYWFIIILRIIIARNYYQGYIPLNLQEHYYPYEQMNFEKGVTLTNLLMIIALIGTAITLFGYGFLWIKCDKRVANSFNSTSNTY